MRRISKSTRINTHKGQKDKCAPRPQRGPRNKQNNAMKKTNRTSTTKATTRKNLSKIHNYHHCDHYHNEHHRHANHKKIKKDHKKQKLTWSRSQREPVDEQEPKPRRPETNECKPKPWKGPTHDQHTLSWVNNWILSSGYIVCQNQGRQFPPGFRTGPAQLESGSTQF